MKALAIAVFSLVVLTIGHFYLNHKDNPTRIIPYPYIFEDYAPKSIEEAESAQILMLGDKAALDLEKYMPDAIEELSSNLKNNLPYFNWGREDEGIHRSLAKLRSMEKWPPIVIFVLGNSEFLEQKFYLKDYNTIMKNFDRYENGKLLTAIMAYPPLSKVVYTPPRYVVMGEEIKKGSEEAENVKRMAYYKMFYKLFDKEVEELIVMAREKESTLILITSPVNLDIAPKKVCLNTETDTLAEYQFVLEDQMERKEYKIAYEKLKELSKVSMANAKTWYLLGKASKEVGDYELARTSMRKATAFDCKPWRTNHILNTIMKRKAQALGSIVIDFDQMININYGRDVLFLNDFQPQGVYYDRLVETLKEKIKSIFKL